MLTRGAFVLAIGIAMSVVACSGMPVTTQTGAVQDIVIGSSSLRLTVKVQEDDEVRWVNDREGGDPNHLSWFS